jgi:hypothetical protein
MLLIGPLCGAPDSEELKTKSFSPPEHRGRRGKPGVLIIKPLQKVLGFSLFSVISVSSVVDAFDWIGND